MKKNIIKSIVFILILSICLIILSRIVYPKNNSADYGMHAKDANGILAEPKNSLDVIIVGNSQAYSSIIPTEIWNKYGYTSYVCASPAQTLPHSIRLLYEIDNLQRPQIIVLEANSAFQSTKYHEATDQGLNYLVKAYQYHNRWKTLSLEDFTTTTKYTTINRLKGFNYTRETEGRDENEKEFEDNDATIPKSNRIYIKKIRDYCKERKIQFFIVNAPTKKYWGTRNHEVLEEFCKENEIEYLDLNMYEKEMNLDWSADTRDGGEHVNYQGALKATKFFGTYLNDKGILKSHKDDEQYNSWNDSYKKYKEIVEKDEIS